MTSPSRYVNLFFHPSALRPIDLALTASLQRKRILHRRAAGTVGQAKAPYALAAERQALGSAEALWRDLAPRARPKLHNQIVLIQFHFTAVLFRVAKQLRPASRP
jgi:hypothetical protein